MKKTFIILSATVFCVLSARTDDGLQYEFALKKLKSASQPYATKLILDNNGRNTNISLKKGVVFTYRNRTAKNVFIAGDFSGWKKAKMSRGDYGVWYYFLGEYDKKESFRYKYHVDGIWTDDPSNPENEDDGYGSSVSKTASSSSGETRFVTYRIIRERGKSFIEFRIYNPKASYISIAGDFNRWNPENDVLHKDSASIWRIRKHLPRGSYRYSYIIDGEWVTDTYNPDSSSNPSGRLCSLIIIK